MPCRSSPRPTYLPADEATPPRGRDARGSRLRRVFRDPTRQVPQGRPDADRARRRFGAHPRERQGATCRTSRAASGSCPRPSCGFRPDLVEGLFSRKARRTLCGIRVFSKDESEERILRYLEEADAEPVACRRRWGLSDMGLTTEELVVDAHLSDGADEAG